MARKQREQARGTLESRVRAASESECTVELERRADAAYICLNGELDMACSQRFDRSLRQAIADSPRHVVIDLRGVSFIDSSGVSKLLEVDAIASQEGVRLWILRGSEAVQKVLRVTGTDRVLPLVDRPPDLTEL